MAYIYVKNNKVVFGENIIVDYLCDLIVYFHKSFLFNGHIYSLLLWINLLLQLQYTCITLCHQCPSFRIMINNDNNIGQGVFINN